MSNVVYHTLSCPNLQTILMKSGVVSSIILHGTSNRSVKIDNALDMSLCDAKEWKEVEAKSIEHGVVDFSLKNDDGNYGVRRDLTNQEISELPYWPIVFNNQNEVSWLCKWRNNDDPAFFISKLFPNETFRYEMFYEGDWDGEFDIKDGEFAPTADWEQHLKEVEEARKKGDDPNSEFGETLPF